MPSTHPFKPPPEPLAVVLDTNVVLDLLLFRDPRSAALQQALAAHQLRWVGTEAMLDELDEVLTRPFAQRWPAAAGRVLATARQQCRVLVDIPVPTRPPPRCADPDDQCFVDLAWSLPAAWLFSRDRAVLALARPASVFGLGVCTPEHWPGLAPDEKRAAEAAP